MCSRCDQSSSDCGSKHLKIGVLLFITFVKVNPSGDWQRGAGEFGLPLNRGAGVSRGPFHGVAAPAVVSREYEARDQGWAAPVMNAEAVQLLELIKSSRNHMGASRYFTFFSCCLSESSISTQAGAEQAAHFSRPGTAAGGSGAGRAHLHHLRPGPLYGH